MIDRRRRQMIAYQSKILITQRVNCYVFLQYACLADTPNVHFISFHFSDILIFYAYLRLIILFVLRSSVMNPLHIT